MAKIVNTSSIMSENSTGLLQKIQEKITKILLLSKFFEIHLILRFSKSETQKKPFGALAYESAG